MRYKASYVVSTLWLQDRDCPACGEVSLMLEVNRETNPALHCWEAEVCCLRCGLSKQVGVSVKDVMDSDKPLEEVLWEVFSRAVPASLRAEVARARRQSQ